MALWGIGLFDNDTAVTVRQHWERARATGESVPGAVQTVLDELADWIDDADAYPDMILALAFLAAADGQMPQRLKQKAVKVIKTEISLARWYEAPDLRRRRRVEQSLLKILQGEAPHPGVDYDLSAGLPD
jgi:hypothetical protein